MKVTCPDCDCFCKLGVDVRDESDVNDLYCHFTSHGRKETLEEFKLADWYFFQQSDSEPEFDTEAASDSVMCEDRYLHTKKCFPGVT